MPGEEDGHRLVAHLRIGHPAAVFSSLVIPGRQQHREEIAMIAAARPPLGDEAVDDGIEPFARCTDAAHARQRQLLDQLGEGQHHQPE